MHFYLHVQVEINKIYSGPLTLCDRHLDARDPIYKWDWDLVQIRRPR
jgi:hypothetical protein